MRIERAIDEIAGGVRVGVQLNVQVASTRAELRDGYVAHLWPDGRPRPETREEEEAQDRAVNAMYAKDYSVDRWVLERLTEQLERLRIMAEWEVLIVDPPAGWEVIATKELPMEYLQALVSAYLYHRNKTTDAAGKGQRSGS